MTCELQLSHSNIEEDGIDYPIRTNCPNGKFGLGRDWAQVARRGGRRHRYLKEECGGL